MADEIIKRDENQTPVNAGVTDDVNEDVTMLRLDSATNSLIITTA